jgi:hypothetical protein
LRPTPGRASSASRSCGTSPPCWLDQDLAGGDDVPGLGVVQADGLDIAHQLVQAEVEDLLRRIRDRVQLARGLVDADVGGLRRQQHGDQQFKWRGVFEFGFGLGLAARQARKIS